MQQLTARDRIAFTGQPSQKLLGILRRKKRWSLSWYGRVLVAATTATAALLLCLNIYPFLAVTKRVRSDTLVVEGWIHEYAIRAAVEEYHLGGYRRLFTTGGPVPGNGGYVNDFQTSASVGAELLKKFGIPGKSIEMVPSHVIGRDRTYSSAVALRDWLREHNVDVHSLNVLTEDAHARRTRLLFARAFGPHVKIGIIAVPSPDYDQNHWWRYSEGVERVMEGTVGYVYAAFFFHPKPADTLQPESDPKPPS